MRYFILVLMIGATFVHAVGSSTGRTIPIPTQTVTPDIEEITNCEDHEDQASRIKCRLDNPNQPESTPEACRTGDTTACINLYTTSDICYSQENKNACFKEKSNLASQDDESYRKYIVLLLYELQERAEDQHTDGRISTDEATVLINSIVNIKKDLLSGEDAESIRSSVSQLKLQWNRVIK